jgi:hypothetical protein
MSAHLKRIDVHPHRDNALALLPRIAKLGVGV